MKDDSSNIQSSGNRHSRMKPLQNDRNASQNSSPSQYTHSEVVMLRQQLEAWSKESGRTMRLLEERDARIEELEVELHKMKESVRSRDMSLQETKRTLADKENIIAEQESRIRFMEVQHAEILSMRDEQIASLRESKDEEIESLLNKIEDMRSQNEEILCSKETEWEQKLAYASARESELRSNTRRLREEAEILRTNLQKEKTKASESDLAAQRAMNQFHTAMNSLRDMEVQFETLTKDADYAETMRRERILQLEADIEDLRISKASVEAELEALGASASERIRRLLSEVEEANRAQSRAEMSAADAEADSARLRTDVENLRSRLDVAEASEARWKQEISDLKSEIGQLKGSYGGTQSLLEATKLALESSKRELRLAKDESQRLVDANRLAEENALSMKLRNERLLEDLKREKETSKLSRKQLESEIRALQALQKHVSPTKQTEHASELKRNAGDDATNDGRTQSTRPEKLNFDHLPNNSQADNSQSSNKTSVHSQEEKEKDSVDGVDSRIKTTYTSDPNRRNVKSSLKNITSTHDGKGPEGNLRKQVSRRDDEVAQEHNRAKSEEDSKIRQQIAAMKLAILSHPIPKEDPISSPPVSPLALSEPSVLIEEERLRRYDTNLNEVSRTVVGDEFALNEARQSVQAAKHYLASLKKNEEQEGLVL